MKAPSESSHGNLDRSVAGQPIDVGDQLAERLAQLGQEHCIFARNGELFAVPIHAAREVLFDESPLPIPQAPEILVGVINLRGEVLPLVQFDLLVGFEPRAFRPEDHVLVLSVDNVQMGLVVDRVREVRPVNPKDVAPPQPGESKHLHVKGYWGSPMGKVALLDPHSLAREAVRLAHEGFQRRRAQGFGVRVLE